MAINELIYNEKPNIAKKNINKQKNCLQGQQFRWQQLTFTALSPTTIKGDDNDDSCVFYVTDGKKSLLLTGDISKKVEAYLVKNHQVKHADILIAPHHGSKSASSEVFLKTVQPHVAIFSSGYLNRWRMPVNSVLLRYRQQGITTYNTAEQGMITLNVFNNHIKPQSYRQDKLYWFAN
jgi:competence protein ComEC